MRKSELRRRAHQVRRIVQEEGLRQVGSRVLLAGARRLEQQSAALPIRATDLVAADLTNPPERPVPHLPADGRLTVNWVTSPPAAGSGGHTTTFRLIRHLEAAGHHCRVYIDDRHGSRAADHEPVVRALFPDLRAPVLDTVDGMADAHAVFATSWETAYPVYNDGCAGRRFYLVQDYEPWFFPPGGLATLAENTYRMGFHGFTAGSFLADKLCAELGMRADSFDFGCDTSVYRLEPGTARDGVVFYARPHTPRRAFELGRTALEIFADRHPELWIHLYGQRIGDLGGRFVDHGIVSPAELNQLYNRSFAGLSLSMTNVSLVPHEMLAAGCIPVVNDALHNRVVLDNDHVRYAQATPHHLAEALGAVVTDPAHGIRAAQAAGSVSSRSWADAGRRLEAVLRREVTGQPAATGEVASATSSRAAAVPSAGTT